jgi:hypothetical protein
LAKRFFLIILAATFLIGLVHSQAVDTTIAGVNDTSVLSIVYADSNLLREYNDAAGYKSFLLENKKPVVIDIQQLQSSDESPIVFFLLMVMLGVLTYVKIAFGKEVEELLQSFGNSNIAQQIFRSQSGEISFSSFLLHANFIVAISLYVQFILVNYFHVIALKRFSSIVALIFLFTFFYVGKLIVLKFIGVVFEVQEECNEYAFDYSTQCKIVGLTLIPALFIFHTTQEKFFNLIFIFSIFIAAAVAIIFVWRGLSTGIKFMYKSAYHFFIYVCVVEISSIFLLFKLLTKTIT